MAHKAYAETDCGHFYTGVLVHTLPCRHKFCLDCVENIDGLMEGHVFSCPLCQNCSQYVKPHEEVFGASEVTSPPPADRRGDSAQEKFTASSGTYNKGLSVSDHSNSTGIGNFSQGMGRNHEQVAGRTRYDNPPVPAPRQDDHQRGGLDYMNSYDNRSPSAQCGQRDFENRENIYDVPKGRPAQSQTMMKNEVINKPMSGGKVPHNPVVEADGTSAVSVESQGVPREDVMARKDSEFWGHGRDATYCNLHDKPVYFYCQHCEELICALCKEGNHEYHMSVLIEENPSHADETKVSHTPEMNPGLSEQPSLCPHHNKPFIMICMYKRELICKDCSSGYHCIYRSSTNHVPLRRGGTELKSKGEGFERKLRKLQSSSGNFIRAGNSNMRSLLEETDRLKDAINVAAENAKAQLEAHRVNMIKMVEQVSGEKVKKCSEALEMVTPLSEFLQQAHEMNMNFLHEVDMERYATALQTYPQVEDMIKDLEQRLNRLEIREEKMGVYVKEETLLPPMRLIYSSFYPDYASRF